MNGKQESKLLSAALRDAAQGMADVRPRAEVGAALLGEFRAHHKRRKTQVWAWAMAAALAVISMGAALLAVMRAPVETLVVSAPKPPKAPPLEKMSLKPAVPAAVVAVAAAKKPQVRRPVVRQEEVATDFFPLPGAAMLGIPPRARLVRTSVPRQTLVMFGLPVNENRVFERVSADVMYGEDGLARAIRFVQ